ncbi:related to glutamyl-tRNA synthetase [Cephalotrichum gorgonifer]|uniref:Glutamate--tRNA ligase, mitochondrial n=1 Tax=Cephalotrichum gorgonifer TaxID=2041049 RepID=A0AAE8SWD6_9PEZI|nr:related to glutamyl-tRNA synthetase [Cephalotrichum gorgonifer]
MRAFRSSSALLIAPRRFICRPCACRVSHLAPPPSLNSFSTTTRRPASKSGGLAGLRSKAPVDRSHQYALPKTPARTRFAPSPTGYLHLGSLRTALYNYLLAKATGGQFILRLEDTDQTRIVGDAEKRLYEDLKWASLTWDEGPDIGGPAGPYRQSERLDKYRPYADQLIESGHAYRCFCSPEDLEAQKELAVAHNASTHYPGTCLAVSPEESADRAAKGEAHTVRFKGGPAPSFVDRVYGRYEKKEEEDDFILIKSDGFPTYHFANVVDDHLMEITHVIRGAEWLISTPKHVALYDAFGWTPPNFSHVGLLVDAAGRKLSKRNHDVDVSSYRVQGFLPSALNNWLVLLGWGTTPGSELFPKMEELINKFTFKFTKGNIKVNPQKLESFQHKHVDHLLSNPDSGAPALRESLLTNQVSGDNGLAGPLETLVQPIEAFVHRLEEFRLGSSSNGSTPTTDEPWLTSSSGRSFNPSQRGGLIPQFSTAASGRAYLMRLLLGNTARYPRPTDIILENPQLIWSVPPAVYRRNAGQLASSERALRILLALEEELNSLSRWDMDGLRAAISSVMDTVVPPDASKSEKGDARNDVYDALRFATVGEPHVASKPASIVLLLLGRDETAARLALAREALQDWETKGGL